MSAEDTAIEQITEVARVAMKRMQAQVEEKDGEIQSLQAQIKRVREVGHSRNLPPKQILYVYQAYWFAPTLFVITDL